MVRTPWSVHMGRGGPERELFNLLGKETVGRLTRQWFKEIFSPVLNATGLESLTAIALPENERFFVEMGFESSEAQQRILYLTQVSFNSDQIPPSGSSPIGRNSWQNLKAFLSTGLLYPGYLSYLQATLARPIDLEGNAFHTVRHVKMRIVPAGANTGLKFYVRGRKVRASLFNEHEVLGMTHLKNRHGDEVYTPEHVLSALGSVGINNAEIFLSNNEVPIFDGSMLAYRDFANPEMVKTLWALRKIYNVKQPIVFIRPGEGVKMIAIPGKERTLRLSYFIDFKNPAIGAQFYSIEIDHVNYWKILAGARTFRLEATEEKLLRDPTYYGTTEGRVLFSNTGEVMNGTGFHNDKFDAVRHKIMDLLGDLQLLPYGVSGHIFAIEAGHRDHNRLARLIDAARVTRQYPLVSVEDRDLVLTKLIQLKEAGHIPSEFYEQFVRPFKDRWSVSSPLDNTSLRKLLKLTQIGSELPKYLNIPGLVNLNNLQIKEIKSVEAHRQIRYDYRIVNSDDVHGQITLTYDSRPNRPVLITSLVPNLPRQGHLRQSLGRTLFWLILVQKNRLTNRRLAILGPSEDALKMMSHLENRNSKYYFERHQDGGWSIPTISPKDLVAINSIRRNFMDWQAPLRSMGGRYSRRIKVNLLHSDAGFSGSSSSISNSEAWIRAWQMKRLHEETVKNSDAATLNEIYHEAEEAVEDYKETNHISEEQLDAINEKRGELELNDLILRTRKNRSTSSPINPEHKNQLQILQDSLSRQLISLPKYLEIPVSQSDEIHSRGRDKTFVLTRNRHDLVNLSVQKLREAIATLDEVWIERGITVGKSGVIKVNGKLWGKKLEYQGFNVMVSIERGLESIFVYVDAYGNIVETVEALRIYDHRQRLLFTRLTVPVTMLEAIKLGTLEGVLVDRDGRVRLPGYKSATAQVDSRWAGFPVVLEIRNGKYTEIKIVDKNQRLIKAYLTGEERMRVKGSRSITANVMGTLIR
ncbi:MAG: UDP-3-O-acyl-N-acetylglucosamine deacetylase, partial [Candidatus Omnitrophica bacterium]|nr:UDP-3-O-acyl-N-acetylglucosamine deacetylase [Candidatus Omnitrophota bacterium]